jgi:lipopolysaccharide transport system ATP-binding protein
MAKIELNNVSIELPIFSANGRSIKNSLLKFTTGGKLISDLSGNVSIQALQDLNFTILDGDRIGVIGHNGSGKSTLLRVLGGVYYPTRGRVNSQGHLSSLIDISLGINDELTGRENIFLRGALLGLSKKDINSKLDEIIDFSELGDFLDIPVRTYSSGMQLRLAFSVATVIRPEILLMDEWLSVGDERFRQKAEARLFDLIQSTKILVIASHSKELIIKNCNRVIWLEHGIMKMDGPPDLICEKYFN